MRYIWVLILILLGCSATNPRVESVDYIDRNEEICLELYPEFAYFVSWEHHPNTTERQRLYIKKFIDQFMESCYTCTQTVTEDDLVITYCHFKYDD